MSKVYVIVNENIYNAIEEGRKGKQDSLKIVIKQPNNTTYDALEMIDLVIGIKYAKDKNEYGGFVAFANREVTQENIDKAIKYLIDFDDKTPLSKGIPVAPKWINRINTEN